MTGSASMDHDLAFRWKTKHKQFKKVPETKKNNQSQETLTKSNQSDTQSKRVLTELRRNIQL